MNKEINTKNSFILYHSYSKHLSILSNEQKGMLLDAIFNYSINNIIPELEPTLMIAFNFIREDIDQNQEKWEARMIASRENGKLGGRPKNKPRKPRGFFDNLDKPRKPVSVSVSDSVNDNNISKDMVTPIYGNKDLISLKKFLMSNYPKPLNGVIDTRKLQNLKQVCSKRKNQDEWMNEDWKNNIKKFLILYLDETPEEYLVNSIDKLREKAKLWREYRGKLN